MKSIADFKNHYNQSVNDWFNNTFSTNPFMQASKESWTKSPYINCMPEPYYGKIDSNSITILNLHPAHNINDLSNLNSVIMAPLVGGNYAKYAEPFPPIQNGYHYKDEHDWWINRKSKFDLLLSSSIDKQNLQPFILEICAWHSDHWQSRQKNYINKNSRLLYKEINDWVITPFIHGIDKSFLKIGLSISQMSVDILETYGFTFVKEWRAQKHKGIRKWPLNRKEQETQIIFTYLKMPVQQVISNEDEFRWHNINGQLSCDGKKYIKVLCMSSPHGKLPRIDFWGKGKVINKIIKDIQAD